MRKNIGLHSIKIAIANSKTIESMTWHASKDNQEDL